MLELQNDTPFSVALFPGLDEEGAEHVTVVVKGTFRLGGGAAIGPADEQEPIHHAEVFHGEPGASSVRYESDACPAKRGTDVVLNGHAHAPKPVGSLDVSLAVGPLQKTVRVFGDRVWVAVPGGFTASDPVPFTRMPLLYERAFGGVDGSDPDHTADRRNPVGTGFMTGRGQAVEGLRLPNLEDPRRPVRAPSDRPPPAGFGFLARHWLPRVTFAGTYDARWKDERCPLLPADFDDRFFNGASPELTSPRPLAGGEEVRVLNASAGGLLSFRLPSVLLEVALSIKGAAAHHAPSLDTVVIEPDAGRVLVTWRVTVPTRRSFLYLDHVHVHGGAWAA